MLFDSGSAFADRGVCTMPNVTSFCCYSVCGSTECIDAPDVRIATTSLAL